MLSCIVQRTHGALYAGCLPELSPVCGWRYVCGSHYTGYWLFGGVFVQIALLLIALAAASRLPSLVLMRISV
jgi:hypothetical protein